MNQGKKGRKSNQEFQDIDEAGCREVSDGIEEADSSEVSQNTEKSDCSEIEEDIVCQKQLFYEISNRSSWRDEDKNPNDISSYEVHEGALTDSSKKISSKKSSSEKLIN